MNYKYVILINWSPARQSKITCSVRPNYAHTVSLIQTDEKKSLINLVPGIN